MVSLEWILSELFGVLIRKNSSSKSSSARTSSISSEKEQSTMSHDTGVSEDQQEEVDTLIH